MKETRTCLVEWRTVGNRRKLIEGLMQEIDDRRMAARTSVLSELGIIDLHLAAAGLTVNPPGWIQRLDLCIRSDRLPNKELIDQTDVQTEREAPAEMEVIAGHVELATADLTTATPATPLPGNVPRFGD